MNMCIYISTYFWESHTLLSAGSVWVTVGIHSDCIQNVKMAGCRRANPCHGALNRKAERFHMRKSRSKNVEWSSSFSETLFFFYPFPVLLLYQSYALRSDSTLCCYHGSRGAGGSAVWRDMKRGQAIFCRGLDLYASHTIHLSKPIEQVTLKYKGLSWSVQRSAGAH